MSKVQTAQAEAFESVNTVVNQAVPPIHMPSPCPKSSLNIEAQQWWASASNRAQSSSTRGRGLPEPTLQKPADWPKDVVYLTQNLVAPSVPDSVARRYVLQPSSSSIPDDSDDDSQPSTDQGLPQATHRDGRAVTLYTTSIQEQVPLVILPIYEDSPWCPDSFHSTSRNLKAHPSVGSFGLFAAQEILPNTFIRPYLGVLHTKADADFHSTYDLSLCHDPRLVRLQPSQPASDTSDKVASKLEAVSLDADSEPEQPVPTALYLDSRCWGNESRFVNDYRGIAQKPNVEFRSFIQKDAAPSSNNSQDDDNTRFQMGLFSTRLIRKGQELVINYGKSYWIHHDQLEEMEEAKAKAAEAAAAKSQQQQPTQAPVKAAPLDPIQAMLQRSRMRVSRTAPVQRPPQQPPSRAS